MTRSELVVLLARQRSGTHPLREVLGSHPAVFCTPEVFHNDPPVESDVELATKVNFFEFLERNPARNVSRSSSFRRQEEVFLEFLEHLDRLSDKRYIVIDVKYNSTHHFDGPWRSVFGRPAFFDLIERHNLRVLHLTRRNYLRYYLSVSEARMTQRWFERAPARDSAVAVDVEDMLKGMRACRAESSRMDSMLAACDRLTTDYDDLFQEPNAGVSAEFLGEAARWLSIDPQLFDRTPWHRKQSTLPLPEKIHNYEEVERALRGTPFEYCLDDERLYRRRDNPLPAGS